MCSHDEDFNARNKCLIAKLLKQGYQYHKLKKDFLSPTPLIGFKIQCRIKVVLHQGLSVPDNDLVYKFKRIMGRTDFSDQFRIVIIIRHKRIGYDLNVMRKSACLVFNPIMVDKFAALSNCAPVDWASDSMMAPT